MPSLSELEESTDLMNTVYCSVDYGSSFAMKNIRHVQSDVLSYENTITPLTCLLRYHQNSTWKTVVIHFIISQKKSPLRDVPYFMQFVETFLKKEKISYDSIQRVSKLVRNKTSLLF